jgi:serine/threonine protein kinase
MPKAMTRVCSHCGREIPPGNLGERCPTCLLDFALEPAAADSPETEGVRTDSGQTAGRRFQGNYEILGEIARGGMGVVYRARQTNVGRLVALKMIQGSAVASPVARLRFQLETTAIGRFGSSEHRFLDRERRTQR